MRPIVVADFDLIAPVANVTSLKQMEIQYSTVLHTSLMLVPHYVIAVKTFEI
jgi:hypothetical protein